MKSVFRNSAIFTLAAFTLIFTPGCSKENSSAEVEETVCTSSEEETTKSSDYHSVDAIKERGILKVGMKKFSWSWFKLPDNAPRTNPEKEWYGWEAEFAENISKDLGVKEEIVEFNNTSDMLTSLGNGEVDLVMSGVLIESYLDTNKYTISNRYDSWAQDNFIIITRKNEKLPKNPKFGTRPQKAYIESTKAAYKDCEVKSYSSEQDYFTALQKKEIDAVVESISNKNYYLKKYSDISVSSSSIPNKYPGKGIYFIKDNENLKNFCNDEISKYASGKNSEAYKWNKNAYALAKKYKVI